MNIPSIAGAQNLIAKSFPGFFGAWTILDHDKQTTVCSFDCFFAFGYRQQSDVLQYPTEAGSFLSYNKMNNPFAIEVSLVKNGLNLPSQKRNFVNTLQKYVNESLLVDVVTPSGTYLNCTLTGISFEQSAEEWADAIKADLSVKEVRLLSASYKTTRELNAQSTINSGFRQLIGLD